jgi:ketosteroid isomerase-like protein
MTVEATRKNDEAEIKRLLSERIRSLHDKNIEGVISLYAQEALSFDITPPLYYRGADAARKTWEEAFSSFQGPMDYEIHDLSITVGHDVAFTHSLNRSGGTLTTGQQFDFWLRWTACFRKIDGKWLIVHHHVSVPVDLETGRAVLSLKP